MGSVWLTLISTRNCRSGFVPVATCSPKHFDLAKKNGAAAVFDYRDEQCAEKIVSAISAPGFMQSYLRNPLNNQAPSDLAQVHEGQPEIRAGLYCQRPVYNGVFQGHWPCGRQICGT